MKRSEVYFQAAKLIDSTGLAHQTYSRDGKCYCTVGAVSKVLYNHYAVLALLSHRPVLEQVAKDLGFDTPSDLFTWNDRATKVTVIRRLLRASVKAMG